MPTARFAPATSAVNGFIYVIGGTPGFPEELPIRNAISIVDAYDTGVGIRVTTISSQEGRIAGGEPISIFGSRFPPDAVVTIGGKPLTDLQVKLDTLITGVIPPGTVGEHNVLIEAPSIDFRVFAAKFIYTAPSAVLVTGLNPTNGAQAGGETGNITGSGFQKGATVRIGENPATVVEVTPTLIVFTVPPGAAGTVDVVVINPDGQQGVLRGGHIYNPLPVIEQFGIEPNEGPLEGRTDITITGENFMEGVVVEIGEKRVRQPQIFFSPTELRLEAPPGTAGPKTVRVVNPDGQVAEVVDGFTYNPAPTIISISPNAGPLAGGTRIIITGTGYLLTRTRYLPVDVIIGGAKAVVYQSRSSPTRIIADTPPSSAGAKDVVVINPDGQEAVLEDGFTYNPAPVITSVTPNNGRLAGSTKIVIRGDGFSPALKSLSTIWGRAALSRRYPHKSKLRPTLWRSHQKSPESPVPRTWW